MKVVSILYHDVVGGGNWDSSGFLGPGTSRYKLDRAEFERHLAAIAGVRATSPVRALEIPNTPGVLPFLLTFDDGGESAHTCVADLLAQYGWPGHFLVTAGCIGTTGFLNADQIRSLRDRGHIVGSHSFSHPERMSHLPTAQLFEEWSRSVKVLSDILGEPVTVASVPRGFYSDKVAEAASLAGIRVLFTSEPTTRVHKVHGCLVVGRFTILQGMPTATSADFVSPRSGKRRQQWLYWNFKKILKSLGGQFYLRARERLLGKT
jgi:peptidoglycan/xylan/chitin deacetylase (PgdA/CDA1 family)